MRKIVLLIMVLLTLPVICKGQVINRCILAQIDSLNKVQPEILQNVNEEGHMYVINVQDQKDFDEINNSITNAIDSGEKNIQIKISTGIYHFKENHILRKDEQQEDVSILIEGNNVVVTADLNYENEEISNNWLGMVQADGLIEVVDEEQKLCRIPYNNDWSDVERLQLIKVQITQWFRAPTYKVSRIDEKGVYFVANDLKWDNRFRKGYNVNFDYVYSGKTPRFRLYKNKQRHYTASQFINLDNCEYKCFKINNILFVSNKEGGALISMNNVLAEHIAVTNCSFDYIRGNVANFSGTGNVLFDHNIVKNTDGHEVRFIKNCPNVRITNNTFENCGQAISNTFCVTCWESTYYIADNVFRDFAYAAIGVGVWHGFEKKWSSKGIIEHNEIYFSQEYFSNNWKYMLMDSGAIYIWTQNDQVIIRYNYIHDYTGSGDNRGIFCDDGANNLKIIGNVILNVPNSFCIDSRYKKDHNQGLNNNANNFMAGNIIDGRVRFQGYEGENRHVVKGRNIILHRESEKYFENDLKDVEVIEDDVVISDDNYNFIENEINKCLHR